MHKEQKVGPEFPDLVIENIESVDTETLTKIEDQILPLLGSMDSRDLIDQMMDSIPKVGFKSLEESIALGKRIKEGLSPKGELNDDAISARNELIFSCARISRTLAVRYSSPENPVEDLFQEGLLGLQKAAEKYDWKKGFKFSTYGYAGALWSIQIATHKNSKFVHENTFTDQEKPEDYENDNKDDFGERIEDEKAIQGISLEREIALKQTLEAVYKETQEFPFDNKRDGMVLLLRLGCDEKGIYTGKVWNCSEIGEKLGVTRERAVQLQRRALSHIINPELRDIVHNYLYSKK